MTKILTRVLKFTNFPTPSLSVALLKVPNDPINEFHESNILPLPKWGIKNSNAFFTKGPTHGVFGDMFKYQVYLSENDPRLALQTKEQVRQSIKYFVTDLRDIDVDTILELVDQPEYTYQEFKRLVTQVKHFRYVMTLALYDMFNIFDSDQDGKLDVKEVKEMVYAMHSLLPKEKKDEMILNIMNHDVNKDERVTKSDYWEYFWRDPESDPYRQFLNFELLIHLPEYHELLIDVTKPKELPPPFH